MDREPKFSSENANKYYESLISEEPGNLTTLERPKVLKMTEGGSKPQDLYWAKDPTDISEDYLNSDNIKISIKGRLFNIAEKLGLKPDEAIHDPRIVQEIADSDLPLIIKAQMLFATAFINIQPESIQEEPKRGNVISEAINNLAEYTKEVPLEVGDTLKSYNEKNKVSIISKEFLEILSIAQINLMTFIETEGGTLQSADLEFLRDKIERDQQQAAMSMGGELPEQIPSTSQDYELPNGLNEPQPEIAPASTKEDAQAAIQLLEEIIRGGYSVEGFKDWQAELPDAGVAGEKGGEGGNNGIQNEQADDREKREILQKGRIEFISKLGDALLNEELPWHKYIRDVKVFRTNFSPRSNYETNYIALSCQFEYTPGKFIEITVLERPSVQATIDLQSGNITDIKGENATYVYVSSEPNAWMEVFNNRTATGAQGEGASSLKHVNFSGIDEVQSSDEVLQSHLDKVVKVILNQVKEIQEGIRE